MARKINHILRLEGRLLALSPLHVGGAETSPLSDRPLAVDGQGRYYLPGASLAGAIRAFCQAQDKDELWGYADPQQEGSASYLILDDAHALGATAELWHGNGIDRRTGAAAEGIKYDREVLPKGSLFDFRLSMEVVQGQDLNQRRGFLAWLAQAMQAGKVPIGAGSTRGLSRVRLIDAHCYESNWGTRDGVIAWFDGRDRQDRSTDWRQYLADYAAPADTMIQIAIHWRPKGPLMSSAARDGIEVDTLPFVSRNEQGELALTLPGAGIKGAWRNQAERIVRTVCGIEQISDQPIDQIEAPLVRNLFGQARPAEHKADPAEPSRHKGRLGFDTCYAEFALPAQRWDELEWNEGEWLGPPDETRPMGRAMHVAIDRWTGGAAESMLYSAVEPMDINWRPLVLRFDATDQPPFDRCAEFALLWLTLQDFCAGCIPLGYGVNRGYGDIEVQRIHISGLGAFDHPDEQVDLTVKNGRIDATPMEALRQKLQTNWVDFCARLCQPAH